MKKFITWVAGIFEKDSNVSSKRFILVLLGVWTVIFGGYYIVLGKDNPSSVEVIKFIAGAAVTLAIGGTTAEALKGKLPKSKEDE